MNVLFICWNVVAFLKYIFLVLLGFFVYHVIYLY